MKTFLKTMITGAIGLLTIAITTSASAAPRPDYCAVDHDHRSHQADYYDYYEPDRYYRAGPYRASYDDRYDRRDRRDRYDRYDRRDRGYDRDRRHWRDGRVVKRRVFDTRHRARIVLVEKIVRKRRGRDRLVCTVEARGRDANYVSARRMHRIARNHCSPRARIRVYA